MAARRAWVLNLDADLELGAPPGYTPTRAVQAAMRPHVAHLRASLLSPDDLLVDESSPAGCARGLEGRAFCPTPRALRLLTRAAASPEPSPPASVLRAVNGRAFAAGLGPTLPRAGFVTSLDAAVALLADDPEVGWAWRIKRGFGMAGRGQMVVSWGGAPGLGDRELSFLKAGLSSGGVQVEPNVAIEDELALHGHLSRNGAVQTGRPVRQHCDAHGAWLSTEVATLPAETSEILGREVLTVASALAAAGYFGPFGVDAYTYRDRAGALRLQPRSEVNARYSMGFAVGFPRVSPVDVTRLR